MRVNSLGARLFVNAIMVTFCDFMRISLPTSSIEIPLLAALVTYYRPDTNKVDQSYLYEIISCLTNEKR
jgi:hypothetical protein